ncbi:MAG: hypothetical protein JNM56_36860 [Planctomycetia bacterium]|nr:hypothetical protein [Planctomycetia bacterium]
MGSSLDLQRKSLVLRQLPSAARVVLAAYLISVGIGYFSALVQLHFQHASAGQFLPGPDEVKTAYGSRPNMGQLERLVLADESRPFNGAGQMREAFFRRAAGWRRDIRELAKEKNVSEDEAEKLIRKHRGLEPDAIVAWIRAGAAKDTYKDSTDAKSYKFVLPEEVASRIPDDAPSDFFKKNEDGKWTANIGEIIDNRCVRCHKPGARGAVGAIQLDEWEKVMDYVAPEGGSGMSLEKLAQSTHVHLLGFAMLYGLTGFIFSFTSYPATIRTVLSPLPLVMQVLEISCWWLARADATFSLGIMAFGGLVALGLGAQIVLGLFDLFDKKGKIVIALLLIAGAASVGVIYTQIIAPHIEHQKSSAIHSAS